MTLRHPGKFLDPVSRFEWTCLISQGGLITLQRGSERTKEECGAKPTKVVRTRITVGQRALKGAGDDYWTKFQ